MALMSTKAMYTEKHSAHDTETHNTRTQGAQTQNTQIQIPVHQQNPEIHTNPTVTNYQLFM